MLSFARILVTGADGFVGRHLIPALKTRVGADTRLILAAHHAAAEDSDGLEHVPFDLENHASVDAAIAHVEPDLVIHLAGQASVGLSAGAASRTWSVNFGGSMALANAMATYVPGAALLFVSSAEVYGLSFNDGVADEAKALRPQSVYARSKAAAEAMLADVLPSSAKLIIARPSNHSGPGQTDAFVIPSFAKQIVAIERGAQAVIRVGNLEAERDFLDVRDVVNAYLALLDAAPSLPPRTTFNIASGNPVRVSEILRQLRALAEADTSVEQDAARMRPSEVMRTELSSLAIRNTTDWSPSRTLEETLLSVMRDQRMRAS